VLEIFGILVVCGAGSGAGRGGRVLRFVTCNNGRRGDSIFGIDVDALYYSNKVLNLGIPKFRCTWARYSFVANRQYSPFRVVP
jgi:hypothetical protein